MIRRDEKSHVHGSHANLDPDARAILLRGLTELAAMTEGLAFKPLRSELYSLPLTMTVYGTTPDPDMVREEVKVRLDRDPIAALESALALLELYETNQTGADGAVPDDAAFLAECFRSKRLNGWIATLGDGNPKELESAVNARWRFKFLPCRERRTGCYPLLNMLTRYGFVYGRIPPGDSHAMGHFIEDFTPGLLICHGRLNDLELALSLATMKLGVPAVVPPDYPFPFGRRVQAGSLKEIRDAVIAFPNIRRLLDVPGIPPLPAYLDPNAGLEEFRPAVVWGSTPDSFYLVRKGAVDAPGVEVRGNPTGPLGVILTIAAEPMDCFDSCYIEARAARSLSMMRGVRGKCEDGRLLIELAEGIPLAPERIGETLIAAIQHEFPRIRNIHAVVILAPSDLAAMKDDIHAQRAARLAEITAASEETVDRFVTCVGCSPFAPDHVCILTPERPPQCGRPYEQIKTGALYGYDDMSNIHHRALHSGINSFGMCDKGTCLDSASGEWSGVNETAASLTGGRTNRVQLHSLDDAPHTGCGCFQLIMFKTDQPRPGIGIMKRGYKGRAPDGRAWQDLHYALAGKQTPGMAGASPGYLFSPRFLAAHGGWKSVVWVSPEIAAIMGERLPRGAPIGPRVE